MVDVRLTPRPFDAGTPGRAEAPAGGPAGAPLPGHRDTTAEAPAAAAARQFGPAGHPNTADFLDHALRPRVGDPGLLMPSRFSQVLEQTLDELATAAEQGTEDARVLNRAIRLLREEAGLRELIAMYRSALYQG